MADSSKTEQATPRKRQKARERGQVVRSRDLISSLALGTVILCFSAQTINLLGHWRALLREQLSQAASPESAAHAWMGTAVARQMGQTIATIVGLGWMAAAIAAIGQGGVVFAPAALQPDFGRMNPATRLGQLFSLPSLGRLLKSLIPGTAIVWLSVSMMMRDWAAITRLTHLGSGGLSVFWMLHLREIAWKSALVLLLWSGVDYLIERQKQESDLRMSRQDLMDEYKETEGSPAVKTRIRQLRRQVLRKRMLQDTKKASVVITNPNEFAVALEYRPEMAAPVLVAKGRNLFAQQIKQIARWHGIPLVENPPLAHALYRAVEVGQSIPPKLYAVVAAILAAIFRAQERAARTEKGQ